MDRREAIRVIEELLADRDNDSIYPCVSSPRHFEALDLAIKVLSVPTINVVLEATNPETVLEQGISKLKNPDDSLLTDDSEACKEQKSKLDCISRQDAIEAVANHFMADAWIRNPSASNDIEDWKKIAESVLSKIPPVTPTERTGEWVSHELWDMPWFTCSECNYHGRSDFKFCPNCGAKMGGDE